MAFNSPRGIHNQPFIRFKSDSKLQCVHFAPKIPTIFKHCIDQHCILICKDIIYGFHKTVMYATCFVYLILLGLFTEMGQVHNRRFVSWSKPTSVIIQISCLFPSMTSITLIYSSIHVLSLRALQLTYTTLLWSGHRYSNSWIIQSIAMWDAIYSTV